MIKGINTVRPALAFLAVALLSLAPAMASARVSDSKEFSGFLAQARSEAMQAQRSAEEMYSFKFGNVSWRTQAAKLDELKTHVNKVAEFVASMKNVESPSAWQQQAVGDIAPMVDELASNVTMAIYHLSDNPDRYIFTSFPEYIEANSDLAGGIADLLSEYVEYSQAKRTMEDIQFDLELPPS